MTAPDSERAVAALAPLLTSLARLVAAGSALGDDLLATLLLSVDLPDGLSEDFAARELGRWARLLAAVRADPAPERRLAVAEALRLRGLPEAGVLLALAVVAGSVPTPAPAPRPISTPADAPLAIDPPELHFGLLAADQPAIGELLIAGGPGEVAAATDRVRLDPTAIGAAPTRVRATIAPLPNGVVWSWLTVTTAHGARRVPVTARWAAPGAVSSPPRVASRPPDAAQPPPIAAQSPLAAAPPAPAADPARAIVLAGHTDTVWAVAWSPDGTVLASGAGDRALRLWRADGTAVGSFSGHAAAVTALAWAPDGETLATASVDRTVRLWLRHHLLQTTWPAGAGRTGTATLAQLAEPIDALAWSPDGARLAAACGRRVHLANFRGQRQQMLDGHGGRVVALAWSPDGHYLASAGEDATIGLWSADGTLQHRSPWQDGRILALAWSPDGRSIAIASGNGSICLWSADGTTRAIAVDRGNPARALAWSPRGERLAVGHDNGAIGLHGADGRTLEYLPGHQGKVNALAWSPAAPLLAAASVGTEIRLWRTTELAGG